MFTIISLACSIVAERARRLGVWSRRADTVLKRCLDVMLSLTALALLAPLFVMVAIIIKATTRSKVIYAHRRVGRNGRPFSCYKFQTMVSGSDAILAAHLGRNAQAAEEWRSTRKLRDDPRVTPVGRWLRRSSLDELPQLINILRGEMSVVGPRPIVFAELERYGAVSWDYLKARPGLTGLWQISGRSNVSYAERVTFDRHYLRHQSTMLDLAIIVKTLPALTRRTETA